MTSEPQRLNEEKQAPIGCSLYEIQKQEKVNHICLKEQESQTKGMKKKQTSGWLLLGLGGGKDEEVCPGGVIS